MKRLKSPGQYLTPHHLLSRAIGILARSRAPLIKNTFIDWFIRSYHVDMSEALEPNPHHYDNFNHFFTRALKPGARVIAHGAHDIVCPVDGVVSQIGKIEDGRIFQAKGRDYSIYEILGEAGQHSETFLNGNFATLYLAPKDYHRVHMPLSGRLSEMIYIPGKLFSVSPKTAENIPRLFARNERVVCIFETAIGTMAVILVGAMIVAGIHTVWEGNITPAHRKQLRTWYYPDTGNKVITLERGQEMGHFCLGSTVIVLFPPGKMEWLPSFTAESPLKMGEVIGAVV